MSRVHWIPVGSPVGSIPKKTVVTYEYGYNTPWESNFLHPQHLISLEKPSYKTMMTKKFPRKTMKKKLPPRQCVHFFPPFPPFRRKKKSGAFQSQKPNLPSHHTQRDPTQPLHLRISTRLESWRIDVETSGEVKARRLSVDGSMVHG